jgi:hypothetical protein
MNRFQPISSTAATVSFWTRVSHFLTGLRRGLLFWLEDEPATLLHMTGGAKSGIVICYECRRRVTEQELAAGLHNHAKAAAAADGTHAQEQ